MDNIDGYLTWSRSSAHAAKLPVVQGTIWRAPDGSEAIFLINAAAETQRVRCDLAQQDQLKVQRMTAEGGRPEVAVRGVMAIEMAPRSVMGCRIQ